jgi:RimJ/RimL family protein N-acetyltransferase
VITTDRLTLRNWQDSDRAPFILMNQDPAVRAHLGPIQTAAQSNAAIDRLQAVAAANGHTFWAMERREDAQFLGFCGLKIAPERIPGIEGAIEIGWRLRSDTWGRGYAREAAMASLAWGWAHLAVDRIIAITTPANTNSWGLMQRLGMTRRNDLDFHHPDVAADDPLAPHITYEILRP